MATAHTHRALAAFWHKGALITEGAPLTPDAEHLEELEESGLIAPDATATPAPRGKGKKELDPEIEGAFPSEDELKSLTAEGIVALAKESFTVELDPKASEKDLLKQVKSLIAQAKAQLYADKEK